MDVLLVGLSSIGQRRVLPGLGQIDGIGRIDVATRQAAAGLKDPWELGDVFESYADAIERSRAQLVYVSLPNSAHEPWAEAAIRSGRHVVVDKPAFLSARAAERLVELADQKRVCLAEATVWGYHPQVAHAIDVLGSSGSAPLRVIATFSFPPLPPGNFRYEQELGGGALWDLGPYAVSIGRTFFGDAPESIACRVLSHSEVTGVDTAFSMMATFSGNRALVGQFGWDTVYRNRVDVIGEKVAVEIDRVFTTPPDAPSQLRVTRPEGTTPVDGPSGDAFALFLRHVADAIGRCAWDGLTADLLADAHTLRRLREAAGVIDAD